MDKRQTKRIDKVNGQYLEGIQCGMVLGLVERWERDNLEGNFRRWMLVGLNNAWYYFNKRN